MAVRQTLGSSESAIGASVVGNGMVIEFHVRVSQSAVLGDPAFHPVSPKCKRLGPELRAHQGDHFSFGEPRPVKNGFERGSVFPCPLNDL
jgi:hypothetical protein